MDLQHIVQHHHQLPLSLHLALATQTEALDPNRIGEVSEHRLHRAQPLAVDVPAHHTVDLLLHPLNRTGRVLLPGFQSNIDLAWGSLLMTPQTATA